MSLTRLDDPKFPEPSDLSGSFVGSLSSISQSQDALLKFCYTCPDEMSLKAFKKLEAFLRESIAEGAEIGDHEAFNVNFFEKLRKLATKQSAIKQVEAAKIIILLFSNSNLLEKLLSEENKDLVADYVNILLTMIDKFDQLPISEKLCHVTRSLLHSIRKKELLNIDEEYLLLSKSKLNSENLILNENQTKLLSNITALSTSQDCIFKKDIPKFILAILEDTKSFLEQITIFNDKIGPLLSDIMTIRNGTEDQIQLFTEQMIQIIEKFIFQLEYSISFERNRVYETKFFAVKDEKLLVLEHPAIFKNAAIILNSVLLRPFEISLQIRAFYIIRRLYFLFPHLSEHIIHPLNLVLSNIAIYSSQPYDLKEATIFLYQIIHKESDNQLKRLVTENENLKYLKESKYYSIKALSYPKDIDTIFTLKNLASNVGLPVKASVEAGKVLTYSFYIEESESILYWRFKVKAHNIKFGIYKMNLLENSTNQNLETDSRSYGEVLKMQKIEASDTFMTGSTFLTSPGYYKVFFDNTYSIWRGKDLELNIHALVPI